MVAMLFKDRREAGIQLAGQLIKYRGQGVVILALPRGGVVLGAEIARILETKLDLIISKKIGHPLDPEYAVCAIAEGGKPYCNEEERKLLDPSWLEEATIHARAEIARRRKSYLGNRGMTDLKGKTVIIVDDGIATGLTMIAAIEEVRTHQPAKIVAAIPVTPADTARKLEAIVDELVSLKVDENYLGYVGAYYDDFSQVEDAEVVRLLQELEGDQP